MKKNKMTLVNASAGTGKTYTLVERICEQKESLNETVATTFTKKAAAELQSRIRRELLEKGEDATAVLNGKIGTVNSVFGRMVSDNAFALGISPETGIVTEEAKNRLFNAAAAIAATEVSNDFLTAVKRLKCEKQWIEDVKSICEKARQNGIRELTEFKKDSYAFFDRLLPRPGNEEEIKTKTAEEFQNLKKAGKLNNDNLRLLENKNIEDWTWADWKNMSDLSQRNYPKLQAAAEDHLSLPSLRKDLKLIIDTVFDCAEKCLVAYEKIKDELGVIDFIDQETKALKLLNDGKKGKSAAERVKRLYVDEFQDTSPVQLALFSRLREASGAEAVYVGDPKQAIYKFRGTDPRLIAEVCETVPDEDRKVLDTSYRTVEPAVEFVNGVFLNKFKNAGMTDDQIKITKFDRENTVSGFQEAVQVWSSIKGERGKLTPCYEAVAKQIKNLLDDSKVTIYDKRLKKERPIRGGDIAVLFRINKHVADFAKIAQEYFKVSASAGKLSDCETGILLTAALTLLIDGGASLAKAQILKVVGKFNAAAENEIFGELEEVRKRRSDLTPTETVDAVLSMPFVRDYFQNLCPDTELAYAEADAFRGAAADYEDSCDEERVPATLEDFLSQFDADAPASNDKDAVVVMNYHKSKGLEWNVVVCMACEKYKTDYRKDVLTIHVVGDVDADDPLKNRKILFLPKIPLSEKFKSLLTDDETVKELIKQAEQEYDRLLYVGMTRARDCLILHKACTKSTDKKTKKDIIKSSFYCDDAIIKEPFPVESDADVSPRANSKKSTVHVSQSGEKFETPFLVTPSKSEKQKDVPFEKIDLPELRNEAAVEVTAEIGTLFHAVLAQEAPSKEKIAKIVSVKDAGLADIAVEIKERFDREIVRVLGKGEILTEWPLAVVNDKGQLIRGAADCILVQPDGFYIVDHKFLKDDKPDETVKEYAGELFRCAEAVGKLTGQKCKGCVLHLPLQNKFLRFSYRKG